MTRQITITAYVPASAPAAFIARLDSLSRQQLWAEAAQHRRKLHPDSIRVALAYFEDDPEVGWRPTPESENAAVRQYTWSATYTQMR